MLLLGGKESKKEIVLFFRNFYKGEGIGGPGERGEEISLSPIIIYLIIPQV
jgi:hypothetical protein